MKIAIIIPAYNEQEVIAKTLDLILARLTLDYRIIIVDDGSADDTVKIVKEFAQKHKNISAIFNGIHRGMGSVLKQGIEAVKENEVFVPVMADGCDDVELIELMHRYICSDADVVCASRYIRGGKRVGGARLKAFGSWVVNRIFALAAKIPCHDFTNSFKMIKKEAVSAVTLYSLGFDISAELVIKAHHAGFKIREVPTIWTERRPGASHFNLWLDGWKYIRWIMYGFRCRRVPGNKNHGEAGYGAGRAE